jgi:hypothetical protein
MGFLNTLKAAIGNRVLKGNPVKVNPTSQSLVRQVSLRDSAPSERVVQLTYGVCSVEAYFRLMVIGLLSTDGHPPAIPPPQWECSRRQPLSRGRGEYRGVRNGSRATMTVPLLL